MAIKNRWLVVIGALLIQTSLGSIYIYSVFKPALKLHFPNWSNTDLVLPSQIILACFALSMIISGKIQDKFGPKITATIGGTLLGLGLATASQADNLAMFTLGFGILGGLGIGAAYVCPIAICVKWFPDKRGLITGLAVAGFGAGGLVFAPIANYFIASFGIMHTFLYLGIIFFIAIVVGARFLINPPAGYKPEGWNPPEIVKNNRQNLQADYTTKEMLKTRQFWFLWLTYFAGCAAGLLIIMNITNIWQSFSAIAFSKTVNLISKDIFTEIVKRGALAVIIVSILNSLGRIAWGKLSDIIGRKKTLIAIFSLCGIIMIVMNNFTIYPLFIFGVSIVGFCFGGFLALYPAIIADYFGTKNIGANYGLMFTAYGAGGLLGPWLAPKLMVLVQKIPFEAVDKTGVVLTKSFDAGSYVNSFLLSGAMCLIAAVLISVLNPPRKEKTE